MRGAVLITGANGFLGGALAERFEQAGRTVIRCARVPQPDGNRWQTFDLRQSTLPSDFFCGVTTLVHSAYIPANNREDTAAANLFGSQLLVDAARNAGVEVVFISSLAVHPGARSQYAQQKRAIEDLVGPDGLIVRPGMILGAGGLFGKLVAYMRTGKPMPLIDRGEQPLQTIALDDLTDSLCELVRVGARGCFVLAEQPAVRYREFFSALRAQLGLRNRFVDMPGWALLGATSAARATGIALPIESDSVLGLMDMRFASPSPTFAGMPILRGYEASLAALFPDV